MTDAPHRIWLHKMPTGIMQANYAISDTHDSSGQVEYIHADLVDAQDAAWCERVAALEAAVAVARAEGMRAIVQMIRDEIDLARVACKTTAKVLAVLHGNACAEVEKAEASK